MKNISFMGAVYSDVPAVTFPDAGGGVARFDDASITTATASDVASGKVFLASDGTITTGTSSGGGGSDVVTFTFEWDSNYSIVTSSCNKTFSECYDIVNEGDATALISSTWDIDLDPWTSKSSAAEADYSNTYIKYVAFSGVVPWADITYHSNGQIDFSEPSAYSSNLVATSNGYYGMTNGGVYVDATVNVPQPTGTKTINITSNGTTTEDVTNYANAQITVNVPGGGTNSWTKIAETSYQVSTTSTATTTIETWSTGKSELWTSSKWVYVRVRDTAGKRNGYFYGCDTFFYNTLIASGSSKASITTTLMDTIRYSNGTFTGYATTGASGYGVYADTLYSDGRIRMRQRYNSGITLTVDGTYKVEVYLLNTPDGVPIFN